MRILAELLDELGGLSNYGFVHLWLSLLASMAAERREGVPCTRIRGLNRPLVNDRYTALEALQRAAGLGAPGGSEDRGEPSRPVDRGRSPMPVACPNEAETTDIER